MEIKGVKGSKGERMTSFGLFGIAVTWLSTTFFDVYMFSLLMTVF